MSMGNNNTQTYVSRRKAISSEPSAAGVSSTSPQQTSTAAASESCITGHQCIAGEPSVPVVCVILCKMIISFSSPVLVYNVL